MIFLSILNKLKENDTLLDLLGWDWIDPEDDSFIDQTDDTWIGGNDVKIFPLVANQKSNYPQAVINLSAIPEYCHEDTSANYLEHSMQVDIYDKSYSNGLNIATQVKSTLEAVRDETLTSIKFKYILLERQEEDYEPEDHINRFILNFKIGTYAS